MKSLQEHLSEIDTKKRTLEQDVDLLNDEVTKLKANGESYLRPPPPYSPAYHATVYRECMHTIDL